MREPCDECQKIKELIFRVDQGESGYLDVCSMKCAERLIKSNWECFVCEI